MAAARPAGSDTRWTKLEARDQGWLPKSNHTLAHVEKCGPALIVLSLLLPFFLNKFGDPTYNFIDQKSLLMENNMRSARPKREKIQERLHGHITNSNTAQGYTKSFLPIVHGSRNQTTCLSGSQEPNCIHSPLAATPPCEPPSYELGGLIQQNGG